MNNNKNFFDNALNFSNGKLNKKDIEKAKNGDNSALLNNLSAEDKAKVLEALNNKDKLKQVLSSDAAQKLLNLLGGKNNG